MICLLERWCLHSHIVEGKQGVWWSKGDCCGCLLTGPATEVDLFGEADDISDDDDDMDDIVNKLAGDKVSVRSYTTNVFWNDGNEYEPKE